MASRSYGENWGPMHFGVLFTNKDTVHSDDVEIDAASIDAIADTLPSNYSDAINGIIAAILIVDRGDESLLVNRLKCLTHSHVTELTETKLPAVHEGKLTVFGHVCVTSKSYSEEVLRLLFTKAGVNFSEQFDNHQIPLLHLAAYCGNVAAVKILLDCEEGINFAAKDERFHTALHMAVKSGDRSIVSFILCKSRASDPESFANFLNSEDALGMTALQHAAWEGHQDIISELLEYNHINVDAGGMHGFTALHLASWKNLLHVVNILLYNGPEIDLKIRTRRSLHWITGEYPVADDRLFMEKSLHERLYLQECHLQLFSEYRRRLLGSKEGRKQKIPYQAIDSGFTALSSTGFTVLHCAAFNGHAMIVETLMEKISKGPQAKTTLNLRDKNGLTPLHHAVVLGDPVTVEMILSDPRVRGNVKDPRSEHRTPLNMACRLEDLGCDRGDMEAIIALLLEKLDVKAYIDGLYKDRQLFVDAANAILVGAALIASITFAGWLQPPLNYQQYYGTEYLLTGAAPPDTYASYAAVRHVGVLIFWITNSLSFFFAIATVLLGACVVLPMLGNEELERDVSRMRLVHIWTTLALNVSVFFVIGAFVAAGFAALPPILKYQWSMIMTTAVGGCFALGALFYYSYRVITLIRKIWGMQMKRWIRRYLLRDDLRSKAHSGLADRPNRRNRPKPEKLNESVYEIYSPPDDVDIEADIIFFHGLQVNGNYEDSLWKTWVARDDDKVVWPSDWLSTKLPKARMLFVSYASSATLDRTGYQDPDTLGENLVSDIIFSTPADIGQKCPVFLVGHCVGGTVIKQFINITFRRLQRLFEGDPSEYRRITKFILNLKGAFFYATPHDIISNIVNFANRQQNREIASLLTSVFEASEGHNMEFWKICEDMRIPTFGMAEKLPTRYLGFDDVVVPEASARFGVDNSDTNTTADHFSVCKARHPNDPVVIGKLVEFVREELEKEIIL